MASLSDELAEMTVTCTAPSKTFNLAGLQASNAVVSNPVLRKKIKKAIAATGYFELNTMAIASTKAWLIIARHRHPATTTHSQLTDAELASSGITQATIRLSIGTEHIDDIIADLEKGFAAV